VDRAVTGPATYYAGSASIDLFSSETANYRDNLAEGAPHIWVALRRQDGGAGLSCQSDRRPTEGRRVESGCDVIGTVRPQRSRHGYGL
jgi:hypothetical protein